MILDCVLKGQFVDVRSVEESDAEFILKIRNDPEICKYLPPLNVTLEQQREWIRRQRADNDSYYVLYVAKDGTPLGTASLYDIVGDHGEVGRYCSYGDAVQNAEGGLLFAEYYYSQGIEYTTCWIYAENRAVLSQNRKSGFLFETEPFIARDGRPAFWGKRPKENHLRSLQKIRQQLCKISDRGTPVE